MFKITHPFFLLLFWFYFFFIEMPSVLFLFHWIEFVISSELQTYKEVGNYSYLHQYTGLMIEKARVLVHFRKETIKCKHLLWWDVTSVSNSSYFSLIEINSNFSKLFFRIWNLRCRCYDMWFWCYKSYCFLQCTESNKIWNYINVEREMKSFYVCRVRY